eukprot:jgi/Picre1/33133/NNA_008459.t1
MKRTRYPHGISANKGRFVDSLAVAYKSHADNGTHVSKRKQRNKDVEIVFDPDSHREFVTGFRKRKQQGGRKPSSPRKITEGECVGGTSREAGGSTAAI